MAVKFQQIENVTALCSKFQENQSTTTPQTTQSSPASSSIFQEYQSWINNHIQNIEYNMNHDDEVIQPLLGGLSIIEENAEGGIGDLIFNFTSGLIENTRIEEQERYQETLDEIGTEFDFMEGKDPNNEESYEEQVLKLGEDQVKAYDLNNDGTISEAEYLKHDEIISHEAIDQLREDMEKGIIPKDSLGDAAIIASAAMNDIRIFDGLSTEEQNAILNLGALLEAIKMSSNVFDIIDNDMANSNQDGVLDAYEFASYFQNLDQFKANEYNEYASTTGIFDGKIDFMSLTRVDPTLVASLRSTLCQYMEQEGIDVQILKLLMNS